MPKTGIRLVFEMETRNKYSKVECELGMTVDGRELPNASVLGSAMEEAVELIQNRVKESYEVVPPRPAAPVTSPTTPTGTDAVVPVPAAVAPATSVPVTNPVPFGN
jgi:hypothetical protein